MSYSQYPTTMKMKNRNGIWELHIGFMVDVRCYDVRSDLIGTCRIFGGLGPNTIRVIGQIDVNNKVNGFVIVYYADGTTIEGNMIDGEFVGNTIKKLP